jgi:type IV secretory pathway protease TraF
VCLRDDELFVNQHPIAVIRRQDAQGRELPRHEICRVLTEGELFVATTHENSFDSRNFGPIASRHLRGTLKPLVTSAQF